MSDLISREALLKRMNRRLDILRKECGLYDHFTDGYDEAVDHVMDFPAAEAEPVRHGKWNPSPYTERYAKCSNCEVSRDVYTQIAWNYCPHCGAKMDGGAEDD